MRTILNHRLIFLDESGFNLHTSNNYGYSPKNIDAVRLMPVNRGKNVSLISILTNTGIKAFRLLEGSFNSDLFSDFLEYAWSINSFISGDIVIMDNARFHHSSNIKLWFQEKGVILRYLPPYTPQLNPIEEVFSTIKNRLHKTRPMGRTSAELIANITNVINNINGDNEINFDSYYEHMREYLDKAFRGDFF
jgi:transposase